MAVTNYCEFSDVFYSYLGINYEVLRWLLSIKFIRGENIGNQSIL